MRHPDNPVPLAGFELARHVLVVCCGSLAVAADDTVVGSSAVSSQRCLGSRSDELRVFVECHHRKGALLCHQSRIAPGVPVIAPGNRLLESNVIPVARYNPYSQSEYLYALNRCAAGSVNLSAQTPHVEKGTLLAGLRSASSISLRRAFRLLRLFWARAQLGTGTTLSSECWIFLMASFADRSRSGYRNPYEVL